VIAVVAFALGYIGLSDFLSYQKTPQFGQGSDLRKVRTGTGSDLG